MHKEVDANRVRLFTTAAYNKQGRTIGELGCDWAARGCREFLQERFIVRPWPKAWLDCEGALTGPPLLDGAKRRSISELCVNLLGGDWFPNTPSTTACRYSTHQLLALHNLKGDFQVQTWIPYFCLVLQTHLSSLPRATRSVPHVEFSTFVPRTSPD